MDSLTERRSSLSPPATALSIASITEGGWPYIQHRGGPAASEAHRGQPDRLLPNFPGQPSVLSTANLAADDRVALFLMDYPENRRRLKLISHAPLTSDDPADVAALSSPGYPAQPERAFVIDIVGFNWNCLQQHHRALPRRRYSAAPSCWLEELARLKAPA